MSTTLRAARVRGRLVAPEAPPPADQPFDCLLDRAHIPDLAHAPRGPGGLALASSLVLSGLKT